MKQFGPTGPATKGFSMRTLVSLSAAAATALTLVVQPACAAPLTQDTFLVGTTGELVALCSSTPTDPLYTAAQNFCEGFAVATYRLAVAVVTAEGDVKRKNTKKRMTASAKLFCPPDPTPKRAESIAAFVDWAGAHADVLTLPPTDGLLRFMVERFPCK